RRTAFAPSQHLNRLGAVGPNQQLKAAESLEGDHTARPQLHGSAPDRLGAVPDSPPLAVPYPDERPADVAGDRLGRESATFGDAALPLAVGAEREAGHARLRPVVGHAVDDRVTRAAIGAGGEGVAPAPVVRVKDLMTTPFIPGPVRRHAYRPLSTFRSLAGENA